MLKELLAQRELPALKSREEMLEVLLEEEYGQLPPKPESLTFEDAGPIHRSISAGRASCHKIIAHCVVNGKPFDFPFAAILPQDGGKYPFFVFLSFDSNIPDRYLPAEELVDNDFGILVLDYHAITSDNDDMTNGLAGVLFEDGKRKPNDPGKIAMWAWGAQRLMDFAETQECLDTSCAIVAGHSRLGKTALLTGATDTRFAVAYSNNSGCSGAALSRGKEGETVAKICNRFPYWFCENYQKYANNESAMPFDQHYLLASIAPRCACVGSGTEDLWADPTSEYLSCVAAKAAFDGDFAHPDRLPRPDEKYLQGTLGYHLRTGTHYFCRPDWHRLIEFVKNNKK
ncbi:MAG: hypothetical protein IKU07_02895 [Oscillospiraceae bacterium]|nr:hypothetical protein [Oscillospiraceae bacterium]